MNFHQPKLLAKYIKQGIVTGPHIGKWAEIGSVRRLLEAIIWVDFTEEQPLLCQQTGVCRPIWSNKEPGDKGQERGQGTPELDEATHTLERLRRLENGGSKIPRCAWSKVVAEGRPQGGGMELTQLGCSGGTDHRTSDPARIGI
ncbi:conserved hypothetical protein [Histoplasma capsulatum var. duboisii H88]|uniref:Uncharacterized protein n=2 Tax=Ajellomyces capsulatus TaxID=5037 RepID=F0U5W7_AJEC8|nr:conserved hypothetical protein [Histoplasma capsulatum H143]EGC42202.1 conserved hypothetical protein [Histoplasma capsulatum var. duboisii H88]